MDGITGMESTMRHLKPNRSQARVRKVSSESDPCAQSDIVEASVQQIPEVRIGRPQERGLRITKSSDVMVASLPGSRAGKVAAEYPHRRSTTTLLLLVWKDRRSQPFLQRLHDRRSGCVSPVFRGAVFK
jgi:hypothetical protein